MAYAQVIGTQELFQLVVKAGGLSTRDIASVGLCNRTLCSLIFPPALDAGTLYVRDIDVRACAIIQKIRCSLDVKDGSGCRRAMGAVQRIVDAVWRQRPHVRIVVIMDAAPVDHIVPFLRITNNHHEHELVVTGLPPSFRHKFVLPNGVEKWVAGMLTIPPGGTLQGHTLIWGWH